MSEFKPTLEQQKILNSSASRMIVSASAGTGKTSTIVDFISELIFEKGVLPQKILVLTFTENAAREMKERVVKKALSKDCSSEVIEQITSGDISTIHSFLKKTIQKNIDKFEFCSDYKIPTENMIENIKERSYKQAYRDLCKDKRFESLFVCLSKEQNLLKEIVFKLSEHFSVQADPAQLFDYYTKNQSQIFNKAEDYVKNLIVSVIEGVKTETISIFSNLKEECKNFDYIKNYTQWLNKFSKDISLREMILFLDSFKGYKIGSTKENLDFLSQRERVKELSKRFKDWDVDNENIFEENKLVPLIYEFYKVYDQKFKEIKLAENLLDFNDLERYSNILFENGDVLREMQRNYQYVFIDEYQDVNPVQEKLLKLISKESNFVAVGDPKQGIYGFRNATPEIMKNDILKFGKDGTFYLTKNFRSAPQILDFVNEVFLKLINIETSGISYKDTSMLCYDQENRDEETRVNIDVVCEDKEREDEINLNQCYDILEDELKSKNEARLEAEVVARRVNEVLMKKIIDKNGKEREVNYSDITILVRGKGAIVSELERVFSALNIPLISTVEKEIESNEEIEVVKNLIKLCVDEDNDIALTSVLCSKLFSYSLEEILLFRRKDIEKSLYQNLKEEERFNNFFEKIEEFKLLSYSKGISFAFEKFFSETDFYSYILYKEEGITKFNQLKKFLNIIEQSPYNYNFPSLLTYLESNPIKMRVDGAGMNAVTIATIHSSKGLEYPVCILAGMGKSLIHEDARTNAPNFDINNEFGLGLKSFNLERGIKDKDIVLYAIKDKKKRQNFIDEIMLLYVAMTRAKNYLFITGKAKDKEMQIKNPEDIFNQKSFMDLILSSIDRDKYKINYISAVENIKRERFELISKKDEIITQKIKERLDYVYPYLRATQKRFKNSVSALNETDAKMSEFVGGRENLDIGLKIHKILEVLNFQTVETVGDITSQLSSKGVDFSGIDLEIILKNVKILKSLTKAKRVFKEKQFTMKLKSSEIFEDGDDEEIMVQGIVDLFAFGEKNILIDYKYTNLTDEKRLKEKYFMQLKLYKKAIEKCFDIKINEIFLLSLKYGQIINIKN